MIIAVDYDGTLLIDGKPNTDLIQRLIQSQRSGATIILWTCRDGKRLREAVQSCGSHGLIFNYINENCPQAIAMLGHNPRKVYADVYIDDKAAK